MAHGPSRAPRSTNTRRGWRPLTDGWWLPGGWGTGALLILSGLIGATLIRYSYRNFREIKATDPTA